MIKNLFISLIRNYGTYYLREGTDNSLPPTFLKKPNKIPTFIPHYTINSPGVLSTATRGACSIIIIYILGSPSFPCLNRVPQTLHGPISLNQLRKNHNTSFHGLKRDKPLLSSLHCQHLADYSPPQPPHIIPRDMLNSPNRLRGTGRRTPTLPQRAKPHVQTLSQIFYRKEISVRQIGAEATKGNK